MTAFFIVLMVILVGALLLCVVALRRNEIIFKARNKRIGLISDLAQELIQEGDDSWRTLYKDFEKTSYDNQMWMFNKWTYDEFYPDAPVPTKEISA
jgi:hypothetical protein